MDIVAKDNGREKQEKGKTTKEGKGERKKGKKGK